MSALNILGKFELYLKSARAQRRLNLQGLPILPKGLVRHAPHNRAAFNQFVLWVKSLGLSRVESVVDVGANHGDFSRAVAALYPRAKVLLVEPLQNVRSDLERQCELKRGRWTIVPCALGSTKGTGTLYIDPKDDTIGSLLGFSDNYRLTNPLAVNHRSLECPLTTLDELCVEQGVAGIDLLKVDVEGFEFEVLNGGPRMLPKTQAVIIEISLIRRSGDQDVLEMLARLRDYGFAIVNVIPSLFAKTEPWKPVEFNVLARR